MNIDQKFITKITSLGSLGYSYTQCINVMDISDEDEAEFRKQWSDSGSRIAKAYLKGVDQANFAIDLKLYEKARNGDMKAIEMFERRKYENSKRS